MATTVHGADEDKVRDCKEDMDTLLVFVSLTVSSYNVAFSCTRLGTDWSVLGSAIGLRRRVLHQPPARPE